MIDKAIPTITLATLYENQNEYLDALVIYKNLYKEDPSAMLQNKIVEIKDKIFNENTFEYYAVIDKIFTKEEKKKFNILPHKYYEAYKESQTELKNEETYPEESIEVKEDEITNNYTLEDDISLQEETYQSTNYDENQIMNLLTKLSNLKPDLVEKILKENVGSDASLKEIKLSDLNYVVELLKASENVRKD